MELLHALPGLYPALAAVEIPLEDAVCGRATFLCTAKPTGMGTYAYVQTYRFGCNLRVQFPDRKIYAQALRQACQTMGDSVRGIQFGRLAKRELLFLGIRRLRKPMGKSELFDRTQI